MASQSVFTISRVFAVETGHFTLFTLLISFLLPKRAVFWNSLYSQSVRAIIKLIGYLSSVQPQSFTAGHRCSVQGWSYPRPKPRQINYMQAFGCDHRRIHRHYFVCVCMYFFYPPLQGLYIEGFLKIYIYQTLFVFEMG